MANDTNVVGMLDKLLTHEVHERIERELKGLLSAASVQAAIDRYIKEQLPLIMEKGVQNYFMRNWGDQRGITVSEHLDNQISNVFREAKMRLEDELNAGLRKHLKFSLKVES